jgi:TonB family protein
MDAGKQDTGAKGPRNGAGSSLGLAALIVVVGVIGGWVALKKSGNEVEIEIAESVVGTEHHAVIMALNASETLLDRAELAFAAGRIVEPEYDSALAYYKAALDQEPGNADALDGLNRIVAYLFSLAESALFQNDWDAARHHASVVLNLDQSNDRAADLMARADRLQRVQRLTEQALSQFSSGRLVAPEGDNASDTYRAIMEIDADNAAARQGLASVAQRLIVNAQSAALAGEMAQARRFIIQARDLDPTADGLAQVEEMTAQAARAAEDRRLQRDLLSASEALQDDRLMPPAMPNAFDLFTAVLTRAPNSDAAQRGVGLVQAALVDRSRAQLAAGNVEAAQIAANDAERAGVSSSVLELLRSEIAHQERALAARQGRFDRVYQINELSVRAQTPPEYPRLAQQRGQQGWVVVEFTVTETGEVRDSAVTESSSSVFDRAAVAAIDRWLFEPVVEGGRAIPVRASVRISFRAES